jgi:hypothetical protein
MQKLGSRDTRGLLPITVDLGNEWVTESGRFGKPAGAWSWSRRSRVQVTYAMLGRGEYPVELPARADAELQKDRAQVVLDGVGAYEQACADLGLLAFASAIAA